MLSNGVMCAHKLSSGQYPHGRHSSIGSAGMHDGRAVQAVCSGLGAHDLYVCSLHCCRNPFCHNVAASSWWPQGLCAHSHNVLTRL
jgi:hypothetical protein